MDSPYIAEETDDYAVVFKPDRTHSAPLAENKNENGLTILEWYREKFNSKNVKLMHRLDYETHGLVLFAKNEKSYNFFRGLQDRGGFIKEYSAICISTDNSFHLEGFPDNKYVSKTEASMRRSCLCENSFVIESYFRPYGPGRKLVRPVIEDGKKHKEIAKDKGGYYKTEIINIKDNIFTVRIKRGFRHQIRCHLCWIGCPILNDPLYSPPDSAPNSGLQPEDKQDIGKQLALRSHALFFADPTGGELKECRISPII